MGHSVARPVIVDVPANAITINIPVNRHASRTTFQIDLTGANTFSVESTLDTILWSDAALVAVNLQPRGGDVVDPSDAAWVEELASASVDAQFQLNSPVAALRVIKTVGAGTAKVRIQQA